MMNIISFISYGTDKKRAVNNQWRIPESRLLCLAFAFGGLGAWMGMLHFRHKTKHKKFVILVPIALVVQVAVIGYAIMYNFFLA
ncbi:MAG: DUF1294 domain-containing protein [Wujia sp.]